MRKKYLSLLLLIAFIFSVIPVLPVVASDIVGLEVTVPQNSVETGNSLQAIATLQYTDNSTVDTTDVVWQSQDESIATVDGAGLITGVAEGDVVIDAIYSHNGSYFSGQILINVYKQAITIDCLVGQTIQLNVNRTGKKLKHSDIESIQLLRQAWSVEFNNNQEVVIRNYRVNNEPDVITINSDNSITINHTGCATVRARLKTGSYQDVLISVYSNSSESFLQRSYIRTESRYNFEYAPATSDYRNPRIGYDNPQWFIEDEFFGTINNAFAVISTRTSPPWTEIVNPDGIIHPGPVHLTSPNSRHRDLCIGETKTYELDSRGLGHGVLDMWVESEPGSIVIIPGKVESPLIGQNTSICVESDHYFKITAPIGDPHRFRIVVELTDENGLQHRSYVPFYTVSVPSITDLELYDLDGNLIFAGDKNNGGIDDVVIDKTEPIKLRLRSSFISRPWRADTAYEVPAPNIPIKWNVVEFIDIAKGEWETIEDARIKFNGINENNINYTDEEGWAEAIFTPDIDVFDRLGYVQVRVEQAWSDQWKLILCPCGPDFSMLTLFSDYPEDPKPSSDGGSSSKDPEPTPEPDPEPEITPEPEPEPVIPEPEPQPEPTPEPAPVDEPTPAPAPVVKPEIIPLEVEKPVIIGTVKGILKMKDGKPLANARLELHSKPLVTYTDNKGYFEFKDVPLGAHKLYLADLTISDEKILIKTLQVATADETRYIPITATVKNLETAQVTLTENDPNKEVEMIVDFELPQEPEPEEPEKKTPIWPWLLLLLLLLLILRRRHKKKQE